MSTVRQTSTTDTQSIADLAADAVHAIVGLSADVASLRARAAAIAEEIGSDRKRVQSEREEREILYSLEHKEADVAVAPGSDALVKIESTLVESLQEIDALDRSLADFASVLVTARRQLEANKELPDSDTANLLAVRMAELRAREEERQRFARDIHDGPAQAFANAIIGLEFVERALKSGRDTVLEDSMGEIERIKATMREGLTEIRRFIFDNRPTMLLDRGLAATVRHYVQSYQSIFPMVVTVDISDSVSRLDPEQELAAFRVVQESIQNASKHARASLVEVRIHETEDGGIQVEVADDGRGFDPARVSAHAMGGAGLKGMEERASLLGAEFNVESKRGEGTLISLLLPPPQSPEIHKA